MTATETLACEICDEPTADPILCEHHAVCRSCADGWRCAICRRIAQDERGER